MFRDWEYMLPEMYRVFLDRMGRLKVYTVSQWVAPVTGEGSLQVEVENMAVFQQFQLHNSRKRLAWVQHGIPRCCRKWRRRKVMKLDIYFRAMIAEVLLSARQMQI